MPVVRLAELPPEAVKTHGLILSGGPFAHDKDGSVFGNRERLLPREKRGFYPRIHRRDTGRQEPRRPTDHLRRQAPAAP